MIRHLLVPLKPTQAMLEAGNEASLSTEALLDDTRFSCVNAMWAAMLEKIPEQPQNGTKLKFNYINHRGEYHVYLVVPRMIEFGKCECFPEEPDRETWVLRCHVLERDWKPRPSERSFAMMKIKDIEEVR